MRQRVSEHPPGRNRHRVAYRVQSSLNALPDGVRITVLLHAQVRGRVRGQSSGDNLALF